LFRNIQRYLKVLRNEIETEIKEERNVWIVLYLDKNMTDKAAHRRRRRRTKTTNRDCIN